MLGVSVKRIGELVRLGKLTRFDFFDRTYVSMREVCQRDDEELKAGTAMKRGKAKRFVNAVKAGLLETDPVQVKARRVMRDRCTRRNRQERIAAREAKKFKKNRALEPYGHHPRKHKGDRRALYRAPENRAQMGEGQNSAGGSDQQTVSSVSTSRPCDKIMNHRTRFRSSAEMIRVYGNKTATMQFPEQTLPIRNERVNGSNPLSGSFCFAEGDNL